MDQKRVLTLHVSDPLCDNNSSSGGEDEAGRSVESLSTAEEVGQSFLWKKDKKCRVCKTFFTLRNRRHHCRKCCESVCNAHSLRHLFVPEEKEPARICDTCFRDKLKLQVCVEVGQILYQKKELLAEKKDELVSFEHSNQTKDQEILAIQAKSNKTVQENDRKLVGIQSDLDNEIERVSTNKKVVHSLKSALTTSRVAEKNSGDRLQSLEAQFAELQDHVDRLKGDTGQMIETMEHFTAQFKARIYITDAKRLLCEECKNRLSPSSPSRERISSFETTGSGLIPVSKTCSNKCLIF